MTISSSLSAGVAGLAAQASRLARISDNISNSATNGYRRVTTDFHSMVADSGSGAYSAGGVRATTRRMISEGGPLVSTNNATDLAVRGGGMFAVSPVAGLSDGIAPKPRLATTGSFRADSNGYMTTSGGLVLMGWAARPDGTIPPYPRDSFDGLSPVRIDTRNYEGSPTTKASIRANLPATETEAGASGDVRTLSIEYFDNLAISRSIKVEFNPVVPPSGAASNQWNMILRDSAGGGAIIGNYQINFDNTAGTGGRILSVTNSVGGAYDGATGTLNVTTASGTIELNIGAIGKPGGLTQISDAFVPGEAKKDGYPAGSLVGVEVDKSGYVKASYDNGKTRTIFQIPLIDVPNENGLTSLDDQTYQISKDSGSFLMWSAGDGPTGQVMGYSLEESATDVARELTELIQTQRAYSSNAKIIQTVDEMLQETTNMKR